MKTEAFTGDTIWEIQRDIAKTIAVNQITTIISLSLSSTVMNHISRHYAILIYT